MAHLLVEAARRGNAAKIRELVATEEGRMLAALPLRGSRETALIAAARAGHLDCVEALLPVSDVGAYCGKKFSWAAHTAIELAAMGGHAACVQALLEPTIKAPYCGGFITENTARAAISEGHAHCLAILLAHPAFATSRHTRQSLLSYAAAHGRLDCVKQLLPLCDAREIDEERGTALMEAARDNHTECALFLLPHSDVNASARCGGATALYWAFERRNLNLLHQFVQRGADPTGCPSDGRVSLLARAMHLAISLNEDDSAWGLNVLHAFWSSCSMQATVEAARYALNWNDKMTRLDLEKGMARFAQKLGRSVSVDLLRKELNGDEVEIPEMLCALVSAHLLRRDVGEPSAEATPAPPEQDGLSAQAPLRQRARRL
ncbi:ankyrin repeat domain-containing protein [Burkholderia vietnamiensis]|uniref:Uncharacterized protein n=1 Tax=Burkholderia vietnamiensis (strain G4 / LMG 22486) TaxID=269482 RepID=A4JFN1_BURVG|nr:hypothetical protein Bcep1808_2082 [Burkholderia vietnamiensis G4]MCB4344845.1 ankyrin repeat domain-containing protein [Burkholderia vietnamiensis]